MFRQFDTRKRAIIASILIAVLAFIIVSPIRVRLYEYFFPPASVQNIEVIQRNQEIEVSWEANEEYDLISYKVALEGLEDKIIDKASLTTSIYDLENSKEYRASISALDDTGKESRRIEFIVTPSEQSKLLQINQVSGGENTSFILPVSFLISTLLVGLTLWVLFFKINKYTLFITGSFPAFVMLPYSIFLLTLLASLSSFTTRLVVSAAYAVGFLVLSYLLILTSNILNGSLYNNLPLEQAGKASQFIFSLISTYLILIYAFGSYQNIIIRLVLSLPFIYYFTYSSLWMSERVSSQQVFLRTFSITSVMFLALIVLSVWPIEGVYAILSASVIFYILLNVALESRAKLNRAVWIEYSVLILLVVGLLLSNGTWGINGTLL